MDQGSPLPIEAGSALNPGTPALLEGPGYWHASVPAGKAPGGQRGQLEAAAGPSLSAALGAFRGGAFSK